MVLRLPAGTSRCSLATVLAILAFSAAAVLPFHPPFRTAASRGALEVTVNSDARGIFHVYFDVGRGINESDSRFVGIPGDGRTRRISVPLPLGEYRALRIDPLDRGGTVTLTDLRIVDDAGTTVRALALRDLSAAHQIRELKAEGPVLRILGEPRANYMSLAVALDRPFVIAPGLAHPWRGYLVGVVSLALVTLLATAAAPAGLARAAAAARGRPRAALALVAVAGVLLNCFPVVFGGRSFVSPNNGVFLLYESMPTLPGYDSTRSEDQKGSDVGAMMWWHLPATAVERESLLHDHELPLWDRYDLCGQPLLGQGQSMLGDPLHWVTLLLGGGARSWDLKYLAAKVLFAWAIGLAVLELTGAPGVAAFLTFASLYLGFFGFRENHPAFFSLCYSPWILVAWLRLAAAAPGRWWPAAGLLALADLAEINSGTVKEAYMLALGVNLAGVLVVGLSGEAGPLRWRRLAVGAWASLIFLLVAAPFWLVFLDTLRVSFSSYEQPKAQQLPLARVIGFFEDLFYRQSSPGEIHVAPSTNGVVLLGLLWALVAGPGRPGGRAALALAVASAGPLALVFGIVPEAWIVHIPFLRNIAHVDNTFSCLLVALTLPLAGWGWARAWEAAGSDSWLWRSPLVAAGVLLLLVPYFTVHPPAAFSPFFCWYAAALAAGAVILQGSMRRLARRPSPAAAFGIALGCVLLLWRQGQYLSPGFPGYVFSPQARVDLTASSPVLDYAANHQAAPARTVGLGLNFFPGYNQLRRVEGIYGIEALRSREYVQLAEAFGLNRVENFTDRDANDAGASLRPYYDALNVQFFLGNFQPLTGGLLNWEHAADLDLAAYRSRTFWPRAFFVRRMSSYGSLPQLQRAIQAATGPIAAVEDGENDLSPDAQALIGGPEEAAAVPAARYELSSNRTAFEIAAPGPGVAVLLETWFPEDFRATVDGREVPYFRVNHAFKGVYLPAAGTYRVAFTYWPRHLNLALALAAAGLLLAAGTVPAARRLGW